MLVFQAKTGFSFFYYRTPNYIFSNGIHITEHINFRGCIDAQSATMRLQQVCEYVMQEDRTALDLNHSDHNNDK